ncbi:hypothetical protein AQUCO_03700086v1 [Aquilegia coerulea]|uniref:Glycosyltransferase 2-like domain-containing protein n=1 Tax=Aquilegia coerulea TaxID=218851 RepID=A0A2G5CTE3_AQUCA|nr:hypothetical protein AQUCO_03700086v1 [Aquilegia coerulea]
MCYVHLKDDNIEIVLATLTNMNGAREVTRYTGRATSMRVSGENNISTPLHTLETLSYTRLNHVFSLVYTCAILALIYEHILAILHTTSLVSFLIHFSLLLSDIIFSFMWVTTQCFRLRPLKRKTHPENLPSVVQDKDYPALDVFICTADPYKEPPINVVNTALSVMAYDYPTDKVSVYVSDDGGSALTLFAFMEATKFASHWLPFCREKNIMERCPEAYFGSDHVHNWCSETEKIKIMYENMKDKVESVVERGHVGDEHITSEHESQAFKKWTTGFTRQQHPTVIQVLLESEKDKDTTGHGMPNLVYLSREKSRTSPHYFKAGALNALLRVSATMTNAPLVLTQDCDMYSNDPRTPLNALCCILDPTKASSDVAYVQFPQRYYGINKNDIYGSEIKRLFKINAAGMDGLSGPNYVGTGCFFQRRAFFGGPSSQISAEIPELNPNHVRAKSIQSETVIKVAHRVASCNYENGTKWGSKMGFRYGSLVEDYYTGFRLQGEGWRSVFCDPDRAAFLGDVPINLNDVLSQVRRWAVGLLEVAFSKYSPITFGAKSIGLPMGFCYSHYAFWPIWSIPIAIYAFLPSLALLNRVYIFPKVSSPWLYMFLFLGAYGQDLQDFILAGSTFKKWYNDQRMWMIRGVSSHSFGLVDFLLKSLGISAFGFNVTNKVVDDDQRKRYEQGLFEFGIASPLFIPLATIAIINLIAFVVGIAQILKQGHFDEMFIHLGISGFVVANSWPIYEAMVLRVDKGRMPPKVTLISICFAWALYIISFIILRNLDIDI